MKTILKVLLIVFVFNNILLAKNYLNIYNCREYDETDSQIYQDYTTDEVDKFDPYVSMPETYCLLFNRIILYVWSDYSPYRGTKNFGYDGHSLIVNKLKKSSSCKSVSSLKFRCKIKFNGSKHPHIIQLAMRTYNKLYLDKRKKYKYVPDRRALLKLLDEEVGNNDDILQEAGYKSWGEAILMAVRSESKNKYPIYRISASRLRIRRKPTTKSKVVTSLKKQSAVLVLKKTSRQNKIEGVTANWYYIETASGQRGYAFGAFLIPVDTND